MTHTARDTCLVTALLVAGVLIAGLTQRPAPPPRPPAAAAPDTRQSQLERARALCDAGDTRAADLLLALRPLDLADERRLGIALVRAGRHAEGRAVLEPVARGRGADFDACLCLARALSLTGEPIRAARLLESVVTDPHAPPEAAAELARALVDEAPAEALRWAESAAQHGVAYYDVLARCYAAVGERDAALATIEACLEDEAATAETRQRCHALFDALVEPDSTNPLAAHQ